MISRKTDVHQTERIAEDNPEMSRRQKDRTSGFQRNLPTNKRDSILKYHEKRYNQACEEISRMSKRKRITENWN